jgi:predicted Fe-Mo cluster-binding NifX family protein
MSTKKIAVPSDDQVNVSGHTGRCRYVMIYTISPDKIVSKESIDNTFTGHARGECAHEAEAAPHHAGEGRHSHSALLNALSGCSLLIARGFGRRLRDDLEASGINAYITDDDGTADEIVSKYIAGNLQVAATLGCNGNHHRH